jgi:DNA-binding IclR family transcriptional regulator
MAKPKPGEEAAADEDEPRSQRQFVMAVARGFDVLNAFVPDGGPLGNQEIAARSGLPRPTVSRIAFTLTELGYLVYSPETEKYRLGPGILALAAAFGAGTRLADIAHGPMQELADATRGTVAIGQADGTDMVYLLLRRSVSRIMLRQDVGSRIPMATTAMGHAYLHALPAARRAAQADLLAERMGAEAPRFREALARTGEEMAQRGFCVMAGTWESEINGAATALRLDDGQDVLALNIGGPAFWLTRESLYGEIGERLMAARAELVAAGMPRLTPF